MSVGFLMYKNSFMLIEPMNTHQNQSAEERGGVSDGLMCDLSYFS